VYGCTAPKLAETLKVSREKGQQMYDAWWELNSPLLLLKKDLEHQLKVKGYIRAIDGRQIKVKHPYKAVNYLCQSMGAILMKVAMCYWQRMVDQQQIPVNQVIHYHDEVVAETILEYGELSGELGVQSIIKAGRYFKTNVPMNGEYKVGRTWGDVH
jgi:DNA polymerase I-like protein with 3'-5' exonuclease and polymerase domains